MIHDCTSFSFGAILKQNSSGFKKSPCIIGKNILQFFLKIHHHTTWFVGYLHIQASIHSIFLWLWKLFQYIILEIETCFQITVEILAPWKWRRRNSLRGGIWLRSFLFVLESRLLLHLKPLLYFVNADFVIIQKLSVHFVGHNIKLRMSFSSFFVWRS